MTTTFKQGTAPDRYVTLRDEATTMLDRMLKHLQADRQSRDDSKVAWGNVGTMKGYVVGLTDVHDAMFCEGQYESLGELVFGESNKMKIVEKGSGYELFQVDDSTHERLDGLVAFKPYWLRKARFTYPAGTVCYLCVKCDYGCADDDERVTGQPHASMTLKADGDYEFFTVPLADLEEM